MKNFYLSLLLILITITLNALPKDYVFQSPDSDIKMPCLIIAPGAGYHKDLPLIKNLAKESLKNGFAVITFNWDYFTDGEKASENYIQEIKNITDLIDFAHSNSNVDSEQIYVAGKSLGSVLAYRAVNKDEYKDKIAGLILLTPIFPNEEFGLQLHQNIKDYNKPTFICVGSNDKANCDLKTLYSIFSESESKTSISVLPGDHGLNIEPYQSGVFSEINNQNINLAVKNTMQWLINESR